MYIRKNWTLKKKKKEKKVLVWDSTLPMNLKSIIYSMCLSQRTSFCHRQSMSITDSCCLLQKSFVCQRKYVSVRQDVSVTDRLFLSQTVSVCPKYFVSFTESFCLTVCFFIKHSSWSSFTWILLIYMWFSSRFVCEISLCLGFKSQQSQLCGPPTPSKILLSHFQ